MAMDYNNKILGSVTTADVDEWCDLNPTENYDGGNRDQGERELFFSMIKRALMNDAKTVDNLTEVLMYLTIRMEQMEQRNGN